MKFGIFNLMTNRDHVDGIAGVLADTTAIVKLADQLGFDIAWFAEHHFTNYSLSVSPMMMASQLSGVTKRIKLGPCVIVLPLHNPLRIAQEIALLDQQTGGRAVLGLGSGYQEYEFVRYGVETARKNEVFLEYWTVLRDALELGHVKFSGKYIQVPATAFAMRPLQKPMPPLYLTSMDPALLAELAPYDVTPFIAGGLKGQTPVMVAARDKALGSWTKAGLDAQAMPVAMMQYIHITDSKSEALDTAERAQSYYRMFNSLRVSALDLNGSSLASKPLPGEPTLEQFEQNLVMGDPHAVAERMVEEIRQIDPIHYNCFFQFGGMPAGRVMKTMERFIGEVVPLVEREVGPLSDIGHRSTANHIAARAQV
jgi:alkanesulfonate monooxygenase SsuD/methylene tetrahydromethanopterin reductase-like flavin-dependent oxidoreductase (luciferase family)